jgi:lipopolysaccharide export system protein LptA
MRNTEAQRYARWSLAVAFLLAVVVAGVYLRNVYIARQAEKKAPPAVPPTVEQRSNEFSFSKVDGQRTIYTIRASRATEFKEGSRSLLEDVDISVYGRKGDRNDTLRTRACDFISTTGKISCAGDVQINLESAGKPRASANAIQVATSAVTFNRDSGEARTDKPVTFRWPAGRGSAVGVSYDSNSGTLRLEHEVDLNLSNSSSPPPEKTDPAPERTLHLTGNAMRFQRDTRRVQMNGDVHAQQSTRDLSAGELVLELDGEFHAHRVVASDGPQLRDSGTVGALGLSATEIASSLRPDGSVDSIVATGSVHATRTTPAGDDAIDAGRVEIDLATRQNVPRLLTASSGVVLVSTGTDLTGGTRRLETDGLEIHFSDNLHPEVAIESVDTLAPARVEWKSTTTANGKSVPQTTQMKGQQMTLNFAGENQLQSLVGTSGVEVTRKVGDAPEETTASRELTAKFDGGEWSTIDQTGDVHFRDGQHTGQSQRAHLDRATDTARLEGSVAFADPATHTTAQSASFVHSANTLRADGRVVTTEVRQGAGGGSNFAQEPAHVSADHLVADTASGHAVYSGKGRLWQGDSVIEAETIELDNPSHTLVAKGHVLGVFPQAEWKPASAQTSGGPPLESQVTQVLDRPARAQPALVTKQLGGQTSSRPAPKSSSRPGHSNAQLGRARGDLLTYWESESRARIEKNASVDTEQGSIQADKIDLFFSDAGAANATKQLSRAVATGDVDVHQEDRRGTSDKAEYTASEGKFVLSGGKPTVYSSTGDTTTGRQLTFYFADDRIVVESAEGSKTVTLHQVEK